MRRAKKSTCSQRRLIMRPGRDKVTRARVFRLCATENSDGDSSRVIKRRLYGTSFSRGSFILEGSNGAHSRSLVRRSYIEIIVTDREQSFSSLLASRALHESGDLFSSFSSRALLGVLRSLIITITPIFYGTNFSFSLTPRCLAS